MALFAEVPPGVWLAGTGHRPDKIAPLEPRVRVAIRMRLLLYRPAGVISGMALGFDTWWAEEALALGFKVQAAVPFPGQDSKWPRREDREKYVQLLARCAHVQYVSTTRPTNVFGVMRMMDARNEWMVRAGWGTVACYNGDPSGGTANTVRLVKLLKKPLDAFDPHELVPT